MWKDAWHEALIAYLPDTQRWTRYVDDVTGLVDGDDAFLILEDATDSDGVARHFVGLFAAGKLANPANVVFSSADDLPRILQAIFGEDPQADAVVSRYGFSADYDVCRRCGRGVRKSQRHFRDIPQYIVVDKQIFCGTCVGDDPRLLHRYLERLVNRRKGMNTLRAVNLADHGFRLYDEVEQPERFFFGCQIKRNWMMERARETWEEAVFSLDKGGEFGTLWSLWVRGRRAKDA